MNVVSANESFPELLPTRAFRADSIMVPLDGSALSKGALPVAQMLAKLERATLHVVYVGESLQGPRQTLQELGLTAAEMYGAVLDHVTGDPAEEILQIARGLPGSLIVMCTHTASRRRTSVGSVAEAVLQSAPARIVLVPPDRGPQPWNLRRVLLAHNGAPSADTAIAATADLANRAGAEIIAFHVAARGAQRPEEPGTMAAPLYVDQPHHEWPSWAREFVERMIALGAPIEDAKFKLQLAGGQAGSEIAQFAREHCIDLVIVPWDAQWERRPGALKTIVRRSGCPVLLLCTASQSAAVQPAA